MKTLNFYQDVRANLNRKAIAIFAVAAFVALGIGPLEATATSSVPSGPAPGNRSCSTSGNFTIAYESGQVIATDLDADCVGTAVIPAGVTKIGQFQYNHTLTRVEIPASVTEIEAFAFANCSTLATFSIAAGSSLTELPDYVFTNTAMTNFTVSANVTTIRSAAFSGVPLTSLAFEANSQLETIGAEAFRSARFATLELPAGVDTIGAYAFLNSQLASIELPAGFRTIGNNAFQNSQLSSLEVPASLETIGEGAFYGTQLASLTFAPESNLRQLGSGALRNSLLTSFTLPEAPVRSGFQFQGWSTTQDGAAFSSSAAAATAALDGQELYALWLGVTTVSEGPTSESQVANIPTGLTAAALPATSVLPRVSLSFAALTGSATATVEPIENPAAASATPFAITGATKIVDIQISGISGPVTVCLDGNPTDDIFHYTGGAWVALPQRTYGMGLVCGVTESFSPFAAAQAVALPTAASVSLPSFVINSRIVVSTLGGNLKLTGKNLSDVTSVAVAGKELKVINRTDGELLLDIPAGPEGLLNLEITHANGTISMLGLVEAVKPYSQTRTIKLTKFVGDRPTLAGLSALFKVYRAETSANLLNCVATVASDATATAVAKAESIAQATCQRVVGYSSYIKSAQVQVRKDGASGSRTVLNITFDRTLGATSR